MNPCLKMKTRLDGLGQEITLSLSSLFHSAAAPPKQEGSRKHDDEHDDEQNHALQEAYMRERRIAETLQQVLLRSHPQETLPGVRTEAFYEAALDEATVGGDSFDIFPLAGGQVVLVVADASGKGLAAAERVAEIRFALRAFLREHADPAHALFCLNNFVCDAQCLDRRDDSTFATLTLAVLNAASNEMICLCAGGEPPIVVRTNGTVEIVSICGAALGLFSHQSFAEAIVTLAPGDTVLLVTDGLTESRRAASDGYAGARTGDFLGLAGLAHLAGMAWEASASLRQISAAIFEGARHFSGGSFHDDVCLLAGRRKAR